jgi:hypothetical protein
MVLTTENTMRIKSLAIGVKTVAPVCHPLRDKPDWTKPLRGTVERQTFRFVRTIAIATTLVDNMDA